MTVSTGTTKYVMYYTRIRKDIIISVLNKTYCSSTSIVFFHKIKCTSPLLITFSHDYCHRSPPFHLK